MTSHEDQRDGRGWQELAAGVWRRRLPGWDETVGVVAGDDGLLLVDAGPGPDTWARLVAGAAALTGRPVRWLAVTHPHFDHVFGAAALAPGVAAFGAAGLRRRLTTPAGVAALVADAVRNGVDERLARAHAAALAGDDGLARRLVEVAGRKRRELALGGTRRVVLAAVGPGHTPCDLAVLVPGRPPVVFCGDLVEESGEPQAGEDAQPRAWPAALDRLLALGGETARYVPGHGAVVDAAFVRAQRAALAERFGEEP